MIELLKNLFFVRTCLGCGTALPDAEADTVFCEKCYAEYLKFRSERCHRCKKMECECQCIPGKMKESVLWSVHILPYRENLTKQIIFTLKMKNYTPLQRFIAKDLAHLIFDRTNGDLSGFAVTFVPRKSKSVCIYGVDQARVLAELTASYLYLPVVDLFKHSHSSKDQKTLRGAERMYNALKSYGLNDKVQCQTEKLLIFDDIVTTGSTVDILIKLAKLHGYREFAIVSLAT
ncbi:MAG: ComF family protein [Clostridia bacterium]|nr:ComF family protein [Clostridia bacterium]